MSWLEHILPRAGWARYLTAAAGGMALGLGLLALHVSNARSYLSEDPTACINCHVMTGYWAGWSHSSHRETATCNDCHVPHDGHARKVAFKMMDGARHSFVFTFRLEPQVITMGQSGARVVQDNCLRCHVGQVGETDMMGDEYQTRCWHCHRETPHGLAQSLSSAPHVRRPSLPSAGMPAQDRAPAGAPGVHEKGHRDHE